MLDYVIKGARVVDGTGNPWYRADVGVEGERIVAIGDLSGAQARHAVVASGLVVSPGFIDMHTHSDYTLLLNPGAESSVRQGVTTELIGNCGHGCAPVRDEALIRTLVLGYRPEVPITWRSFGEYLGRLESARTSINVAALVPHGAIRAAAMGFESRPCTPAELEDMKGLVARAMSEGAFGMSTGLEYAPGNNSTTDELVELGAVVGHHGGIYATHQRSRDYRYLEATAEALEVAERGQVRVHLSHFAPKYGSPPGAQHKAMEAVEQVRQRGADVSWDMIPYVWGLSSLPSAILPPWVFEGGASMVLKRLQDPAVRQKVREYKNPLWKIVVAGHWEKLVLMSSKGNPEAVGKTIAQISAERGVDAYDAMCDLILEEGEDLYSLIWVGQTAVDEEVADIIAHPLAAIASDGMALAPYGVLAAVKVHPTCYGWVGAAFRQYMREKRLLRLEEVVRKITSFPAQRLGLKGRGLLKEGFYADLAIFDPETIKDNATVANSTLYTTGVRHVLVNGTLVVENGEHTGAASGRVLAH